MTDKDPIREHMARYTKMLLLPCFGATEKIKYRITPIAVMQYSRNPVRQATTFKEGLRDPMKACILVACGLNLKSAPNGCCMYSCSTQIWQLLYLHPPEEPQAGLDFPAWLQRKPPDLQQRGDWLLLRGVQHNGDAAHDAQNAPHNAEYVQALLEHQMGQHSAAETAQLVATLHPAFEAALLPPS